jgi:hypothetical protein
MPGDGVMTEWHTEITVFEKSGGPLTRTYLKIV